MIYSIHVHKTAGTSFRHGLGEAMEPSIASLYVNDYGQLCLMGMDDCDFDCYLDKKIKSTPDQIFKEIERRKAILIHGHYSYSDIDLFTTPVDSFITWIRHPVDRMISDWKYWCARYLKIESPVSYDFNDLKSITTGSPYEFRKFVSRQSNIYRRMLGGIHKYKSYKFIGETENYEFDLEKLSYILSVDIPVKKSNTSLLSCEIPLHIKGQISIIANKDIQFYQELLHIKKKNW